MCVCVCVTVCQPLCFSLYSTLSLGSCQRSYHHTQERLRRRNCQLDSKENNQKWRGRHTHTHTGLGPTVHHQGSQGRHPWGSQGRTLTTRRNITTQEALPRSPYDTLKSLRQERTPRLLQRWELTRASSYWCELTTEQGLTGVSLQEQDLTGVWAYKSKTLLVWAYKSKILLVWVYNSARSYWFELRRARSYWCELTTARSLWCKLTRQRSQYFQVT